MRILSPVSSLMAIGLWLGLAGQPVPSAYSPPRAQAGPIDTLYAAPGDLNYSYGPSGADLRRLTASNNAVTANFTVTYDANFNANQPAKDAFQAAVNIWANTIASPATIRVRANFAALGADVLGSAGPTFICRPSSAPNSWYAAALADKLQGSQFCAAAGAETHEIVANFSSDFSAWEFGTTGVGVPGKYNFLTVVLHELGHGLGFYGSMTSNGTEGGFGRPPSPLPDIYDRFAVTGGGSPLLGFANPSVALHSQLVSNNTFFSGPNSGSVKLETHNFTTAYGATSNNGWKEGSSYSHVDDVLYTGTPNGLMTWALNSNEVYTDPGPIMRGMFMDEGWTITAAVTCTYSLTPTSINLPAPASAGNTIGVTTQPGCSWTAVSNAPSFVTITGGASGSGSGTVTYSTAANTSTSQRIGTMTIAGLIFTITQAGRPATTVPNDLDGDGLGDLVVWRPGSGTWFSLTSSSGYSYAASGAKQWGNNSLGDVPLMGNIDGDTIADLIVWRASTGTWYWLTSSTGYSYGAAGARQWGNQSLGDVPMLGDVDGDSLSDLIVWRASTGTWYWLTSSSGYSQVAGGGIQWGNPSLGDRPVLGDFDGDGKADLGVWRASTGTWYWLSSSSGYSYASAHGIQWGNEGLGDMVLTGDIDGDGRTDLILWRPTDGTWYWLTSASNYAYASAGAKQWGNNSLGDVPLIGDFDGDGRADLTVWRASTGTWYWLTSSSGYSYSSAIGRQWGSQSQGDIPMSK
jgi:VCBS repeat protein